MRSLDYLRGRRLWFVPNFSIWGLAQEAELFYLGVEEVDGSSRVSFGAAAPGGLSQDVLFSDLIDFRGNQLPPQINSPKILIRPQSPTSSFISNQESDSGFRIARDPSAPESTLVDLFIFELG